MPKVRELEDCLYLSEKRRIYFESEYFEDLLETENVKVSERRAYSLGRSRVRQIPHG